MTYVRKLIALILTVMFLAILIICAGVILSLKNVNVKYNDYSGKYLSTYQALTDKLNDLKGLSIFTVGKEDVEQALALVENSEYVSVVSVERIYPSTVNVVVEERVERFATIDNGAYNVFDSNGNHIKVTNENKNNIDGAANVIVEGVQTEEGMRFIANACNFFKREFGDVRVAIESINFPEKLNSDYPSLTLNLRCGVSIEIVSPKTLLENKISAAITRFKTLTDMQKISGKIRSYEMTGNIVSVRAVYQAN